MGNNKKKRQKGAVNGAAENIDLFYRVKHHKNYPKIYSHGRRTQGNIFSQPIHNSHPENGAGNLLEFL